MNNGNGTSTCKHIRTHTHKQTSQSADSMVQRKGEHIVDMHIRSTAQEINNRITSQG